MYYCEVPGCTNHSKMPGITVYMFPSEAANPERHSLWKQKVGLSKSIANDVYICNMHFHSTDFYQRKRTSNATVNKIVEPLLKPTAIPSRNLPGQCYEENATDYEDGLYEDDLVKKPKLMSAHESNFNEIPSFIDRSDTAIKATQTFMQRHFNGYWEAKENAKLNCIKLDDNKRKNRRYEIVIPPQSLPIQHTIKGENNAKAISVHNVHEYSEPINVTVTEDEKIRDNRIFKPEDAPPEYIADVSNQLSDIKKLINSRMDKIESEIAELRNINLLAQQFPFDNPTDLLDFESKLKTTPDLLQSFQNYLNSIPSTETGEFYLTKILGKLFTNDVRKNCVWGDTLHQAKTSGRQNRTPSKIVINNFKIINLIRSSVLQQFNANVNYNRVEDEFKKFFCY